uniref:Uncharacterized protein n=1 Tax=Anopheles epiroticus TaxID=199890 RepID=A0A182PU99_9DIPT
MEALQLLATVTVAVVVVATTAGPTHSTSPSTADSTEQGSVTASSSAAPTSFLTVNRCEEEPFNRQHVLDPSKIPPDCRCPPGFMSIRPYAHSTRALCAAVVAPGPWYDACVPSGTGTDYYELDASEQAEVRELLLRMNATECWISARRLLQYGGLVRRLPGSRWNAPVQIPSRPALIVANYSTTDQDCATVRVGADTAQLAYRNCSAILPQLCLYRESTMLRLHCDADEYTTRYASHQRFCFSIAKSSKASATNRSFTIDSNRKRQLLFELLYTSKDCNNSANVIYANQGESAHHVQRRDRYDSAPYYRGLVPIVSSDPTGLECITHQRLQIERKSLAAQDGSGPGMFLYFDKAHHKLLLTVYGERWFWREDTSSPGFACFANTNDEQLLLPRVKKLRASRVKWAEMGRNGSAEANRTMYELKLSDYGPPRPYWCEAHLVPDFALIRTDPVLAQRKANCRRYFAATIELLLERSSSRAPEVLRLKDFDGRVEEYIKDRRKGLPEQKHIFAAIKSIQVKRVEDYWTSASSDWYTVRLLLHIVTKCAKKWDNADLLEPESNEIAAQTRYKAFYQLYLRNILPSVTHEPLFLRYLQNK